MSSKTHNPTKDILCLLKEKSEHQARRGETFIIIYCQKQPFAYDLQNRCS